jgi:hypothetical protein
MRFEIVRFKEAKTPLKESASPTRWDRHEAADATLDGDSTHIDADRGMREHFPSHRRADEGRPS